MAKAPRQPDRLLRWTLIAFSVVILLLFAYGTYRYALQRTVNRRLDEIRAAGYPCARVLEKERASEGSSVWRVKCNSGSFSVTMDGDSASAVTRID